jgi:hypothetical protein
MKQKVIPSDQNLEERLAFLRGVAEREPAAAAKGRMTFLEKAGALRALSSKRSHSNPVKLTGMFRPGYPTARRTGVMNFVRAAVLVLVILFGGGTLTVYASQGSLPGDGLYPLKMLSEDTLLSLTASPEKRLDLTLDFTDRRLTEMARLQTDGRSIPQNAVDRYNDELDQTLELAAAMQEPVIVQSLQTVSSHAEEQLRKMKGMLKGDSIPPALLKMQTRLQEQQNLANNGQADPQGFRQKFQEQDHPGHGKPDTGGSENNPATTPVPSENSSTPTGNPGKGKPGPNTPDKVTPSSASNNKGPDSNRRPHHSGRG